MKFEEALRLAKEGKTATNGTITGTITMCFEGDVLVFRNAETKDKTNSQAITDADFGFDWKIVEEDDWNLIQEGESHPLAGARFDGKSIRKLKRKILEDLGLNDCKVASMAGQEMKIILDKRFGF
jgi:hypothetical protein